MIDWYEYWKVVQERRKKQKYWWNDVKNELNENKRELVNLALFCALLVIVIVAVSEIGR